MARSSSTQPRQTPGFQIFELIEEQLEQDDPVSKPISSLIYDKFFSSKKAIARFIFILVAVCYTAYQIMIVTKYYLSYPSRVSVEQEELNVLKHSLPGVTICNKNLISTEEAFNRQSKDLEKIKPVYSLLDQFMSNLSSLGLTTKPQPDLSPEMMKKKIEIYEVYMSTYYEKLSVSTQLNHGPALDKFLVHLECNRKGWPEWDSKTRIIGETKFLCEDSKWIHTAQGKGNCITLFHGAAPQEPGSHKRRKESRYVVDISPISKELNSFVPLELAKFVIDFGPENYTDLRKEPGGEIIFHDNRSIPLEASLSYTIKPGKYYLFHVKKSSTHSLPPPFKTNCTDYYGKYWMDYQKSNANISTINEMPLSRTHCLEHCMLINVIEHLKCWPKEIPFVSGYQLTPLLKRLHENLEEKNVVWCHRKYPNNKKKLIEVFQNFSREEKKCFRQCGPDCLRDYYQTFFQEVDWPSDESIMVEKDPIVRDKLTKLKSCCALISLRYSTSSVHINEIQPSMPLVNYLSEVGGIMSMYTGAALISLYSIIEFVSDRIYFRRKANTITHLQLN